jgi:hypothetical protein
MSGIFTCRKPAKALMAPRHQKAMNNTHHNMDGFMLGTSCWETISELGSNDIKMNK